MERPLLILSDAHLSKDYGSEISRGLAEILSRHRDAEVIFAGDIFDLSLDSAEVDPADSLNAAVAPHESTIEALRAHIALGGKVTFVPGNHDSSLSHKAATFQLRKLLGANDDRTIEFAPWFLRRDGVHIEHGHLYDPDCAPNHPLARPNPRSEGLGTALMRRFVAPNDALFLAHANQMTPISGLKIALDRWGIKLLRSRPPWLGR
jgi:predicted phosphodiesterase